MGFRFTSDLDCIPLACAQSRCHVLSLFNTSTVVLAKSRETIKFPNIYAEPQHTRVLFEPKMRTPFTEPQHAHIDVTVHSRIGVPEPTVRCRCQGRQPLHFVPYICSREALSAKYHWENRNISCTKKQSRAILDLDEISVGH